MQVQDFIGNSKKPQQTVNVINQAVFILQELGIPINSLSARRLERMGMAFLAIADVKKETDWKVAKGFDGTRALKSRDIIAYINQHFGEKISSGSYDDIRRQDLKLPVVARIILNSAADPNAARNSPTRAYALAPEVAQLVRKFGTKEWQKALDDYLASHTTLKNLLATEKLLAHVPVILPGGKQLRFSPGAHNQLQQAVIEQFLPRYGYGAEVLYVGDAADKFLHLDNYKLKQLQFFEISHGELPDIIAYSEQKNWLYLIEAVHTSGPISQLRLLELQRLTQDCTAEIIYVTAFLTRDTFRRFAPAIAWETEVWIAETPDHLIHFNGERFLGPYTKVI